MKYLISILMLSISTFAQGVKLSGSFSTGNLTAGTINSNQVSHTHNIYILGDSIPSNVNNLALLLGFPWTEINRGIGGDTTTGMLHRSTNEIVNGDAEAVVVSGGYNDLFASATVGIIETNLQTIFNNAHTSGIKVIALSLTPSKTFASWTSTIQTNITNINYWVLNTASNVDFRINAYTNLVDPSTADTLLPAYDSGDHLHLSTLGYSTMGSNIVRGITLNPSTNMTLAILSGRNVALNQNLRRSSSPVFAGITIDTDGIFVSGDNNHYVGIGTASPSQGLDVAKVANFQTTVFLDGYIYLPFTTTSTNGIFLKQGNPWLHDFQGSGTDGGNVFLGQYSGNFTMGGTTTQGSYDTGVGHFTLNALTTGSRNSAFGYESLQFNTTADQNSGFGYDALHNATTGGLNTANGYESLFSTTTGAENVGVGRLALFYNVTGTQNVGIGELSGNNSGITNYTACTFIGFNTSASTEGITDSSAIGQGAVTSKSHQVVLGASTVTEVKASNANALFKTLNLSTIRIAANNAAALALSPALVAGDIYRTGADPDVLCIVH